MAKDIAMIEQTLVDDCANALVSKEFQDVMNALYAFKEDGDITFFKDRNAQEGLYNVFCLADAMKKIAEFVAGMCSDLVLETKLTDEDGKDITNLYGLKIKNNGSQTSVTNSYNLMKKASEQENVPLEKILLSAKISVKDLATATGRTEDYIKKTYNSFITTKQKASSVVRAF